MSDETKLAIRDEFGEDVVLPKSDRVQTLGEYVEILDILKRIENLTEAEYKDILEALNAETTRRVYHFKVLEIIREREEEDIASGINPLARA